MTRPTRIKSGSQTKKCLKLKGTRCAARSLSTEPSVKFSKLAYFVSLDVYIKLKKGDSSNHRRPSAKLSHLKIDLPPTEKKI